MPIGFIDRLKTTNRNAFGIVAATDVAGHRCVVDLDALYNLPDAILSLSKNNTDNDAIGQIWYVWEEGKYYQLINWDERKSNEGWRVFTQSAEDVIDNNWKDNQSNINDNFDQRIGEAAYKIEELLNRISDLDTRVRQLEGGSFVYITNISLDKDDFVVRDENESINILATIEPENAGNPSVKWVFSGDTDIIPEGTNPYTDPLLSVKPKGNGEVYVKAVAIDGSGVESEEITVTVLCAEYVQVEGVQLSSNVSEITSEGGTITINATIAPSDAKQKVDKWTYDTSAFSVSSQTDSEITLTYIGSSKTGSYQIGAIRKGISGNLNVSVNIPDEKADPVITLTGPTSVKAGDTVIIDASVDYYMDEYHQWFIEPEESIVVQSSTSADIVFKVNEGVAAGTEIEVCYEVSGYTTQFVEKILRITVVEKSSEITDLDMGGASTNATSVIDCGNASSTATSVIDLGNANV